MEAWLSTVCSTRKVLAEHRKAALGLLSSRLVLNHVPMLYENSIFDSKNVGGDPINRLAKAGESAMNDDEIFVGDDDAGLVLECRREAFDEVEESFAPGLDVSAVLDVVGRPVSLGLGVIPSVEKRIERFEDQRLVP